jgi:hypothetical protein
MRAPNGAVRGCRIQNRTAQKNIGGFVTRRNGPAAHLVADGEPIKVSCRRKGLIISNLCSSVEKVKMIGIASYLLFSLFLLCLDN